jgi:hypothetical protein
MSGGLRSDLFADLLECERQADLVVAVGTSLCGMNADRVVSSAAERAAEARTKAGRNKRTSWFQSQSNGGNQAAAAGSALGSVIVSIQKTVHDKHSSLRIFGLIDDVMSLLAKELGVDADAEDPSHSEQLTHPPKEEDDVFMIPYGSDGLRSTNGTLMKLDLRTGSELVVSVGPLQGSKAVCMGRNKQGHWRIKVDRKSKHGGWAFSETFLFGSWWALEAAKGEVEYVPLVAALEDA